MYYLINTSQENSVSEISRALASCISHHSSSWKEVVFLCIGTDRVTGDCLGPWIGQLLGNSVCPGISVYGTLSSPVHALNLADTWNHIQFHHPRGLVIAIDASLGQKKHLGYVTIANGSLHPGAAVRKSLPAVGHIAITGIVNTSGAFRQFALQTTRLSDVIFLADQIFQGISFLICQEKFI